MAVQVYIKTLLTLSNLKLLSNRKEIKKITLSQHDNRGVGDPDRVRANIFFNIRGLGDRGKNSIIASIEYYLETQEDKSDHVYCVLQRYLTVFVNKPEIYFIDFFYLHEIQSRYSVNLGIPNEFVAWLKKEISTEVYDGTRLIQSYK